MTDACVGCRPRNSTSHTLNSSLFAQGALAGLDVRGTTGPLRLSNPLLTTQHAETASTASALLGNRTNNALLKAGVTLATGANLGLRTDLLTSSTSSALSRVAASMHAATGLLPHGNLGALAKPLTATLASSIAPAPRQESTSATQPYSLAGVKVAEGMPNYQVRGVAWHPTSTHS